MGKTIAETPVSAEHLGALIDLIGEGVISGKHRQGCVRRSCWRQGGDPRAIVESRGLTQVTDTGAIEKVVDEVIAANPKRSSR